MSPPRPCSSCVSRRVLIALFAVLLPIVSFATETPARTLVHLINLSGHSEAAYFAPIEMHDISVELDERFTRARAVSLGRPLPLTVRDGHSHLVLPSLQNYEVLVLE